MAIHIQFSLEHALGSMMISWFSSGHFSHTDGFGWDGRLIGARTDRVGGKPAGVQSRPQGYAHFIRRVVFEIPATSAQQSLYWAFLDAQLGKPYDYEAIWGFLFNRDWRETDSWICSELQAAALEYAGVIRPLYLAANKITPVALALTISAIGGKVVS